MSLIAAICLLSLAKAQDAAFDAGPNPLLVKHPTVNATSIVFEFAGDLWKVPRAGGDAIRLTASKAGTAGNPFFSPDGTKIAFSAEYDGNRDAYVMDADGGVPKRLTAHPGPDEVVGWSPDGESVLIRSVMLSNTDYQRLFTVSVSGGMPRPLPFPAGMEGSFSPDGSHIAYVPNPKWELAWKRYRGGQTTPIWIGDISDSSVNAIPRKNTNDFNPMWVGDSIYYLSDPTGPVGLNRYDVKTKKVSTVIPGNGFDIKSATAGFGVIAYEKLGSIHLFDPSTRADQRVDINIRGDFAETRTEWKDLGDRISSISPSPSGKRVAVTARGWAFSVPASKGETRILDDAQGKERSDASWSPDGRTIAFLQDDRTGQHLVLSDAASGTQRAIALGEAPGIYGNLAWSPDSTKIAYTDNKLNLWLVDVANGQSKKLDTGIYRSTTRIDPHWSFDSKWLTYVHDLPNFQNGVVICEAATGTKYRVTRGLAECSSPVFDRNGKYVYFLASTDIGVALDTEDIAPISVANVTTHAYVVLLQKDIADPFSPESDEENADKPKDSPSKDKKPTIDFDGISDRIIPLPMPTGQYTGLVSGPAGSFFATSENTKRNGYSGGGPGQLFKFTMSDRKANPVAPGVAAVIPTADGSKLLIEQGGWKFIGTDGPGEGSEVDFSGVRAKINPLIEWREMYHQAWRKERILFYDPGLHGIDSQVMEKRYEPFVKNIRSREDLNYLFTDMMGEICIGHMFIGGGDHPFAPHVGAGLLGADFEFANGRYRIVKVYTGESWNPGLYSPLGNPGVRAQKGDYILAIDGKEITQANDIYLALEGKASQRVEVKLGPTPDGKNSRTLAVRTVASEFALRNRAWEEANRKYVDEMTHGRCGYIVVPDTNVGGWIAFMRYYYSQNDKDAIIVDERFNHGGAINDFMVNEMEKPLDFFGATRYGAMFKTPNAAIYGPKVMLINEMAGSGGDIFPYIFKAHHTGKLVGHKTWGGELTASGFQLIDGGSIRAPEDAQFDVITGDWTIDNVGVTPDIPVEFDPKAWRNGVDSQLKVAVDEILKQLANYHPKEMVRPKYPNKSKLEYLPANTRE